jgi:hypothetical protein
MPESEKLEDKKKQRLKEWLSDRSNLALIGIMIFAFIVRLYYYFLTKNQPMWWDESGYMAAAKSYAGIGHYQLENIRLPGFPLLASIFFRIGLTSEPLMRFVLLFIPSIILIFLTYKMIKEMYPDKRIALISTAIITVLWENLFYSNRFQTENLAIVFEFLAIFILFKSYIKKENSWFISPKYSLVWVTLLAFVSILFRPGNVMFVPAVFLFVIILNKSIIFSKKGLIASAILVVAAILAVIFIPKIAGALISYYYHPERPLALNVLSVFYGFYQSSISWLPSLFFWAFLFGIFLLILDFSISFDKFKQIAVNGENLDFKSDVFNILLIISILFIFIFLMRTYDGFEYRWFFPLLPGMLAFTSKGVISFSQYLAGAFKNKKFATALIVIIVLLGVCTQLVHADNIIRAKLDSYLQVKQSGLWLKENSNPNDIIVSASVPQHAYYSERQIENFYVNNSNENETAFDQKLLALKPKYLVISVFEPGFQPDWALAWPSEHNQTATLVQAYYLDSAKQQLALIIYELKYGQNNRLL